MEGEAGRQAQEHQGARRCGQGVGEQLRTARGRAGLVGVALRSHPSEAEAGVAGALMLLRDRVPVRDSCVLKS